MSDYDRTLAWVRSACRDSAVAALTAILVEHAPATDLARMVDSTRCPDHNPKDHPKLFANPTADWDVMDDCPNCVTSRYVHCSSHRCYSCDYPCETVELISNILDPTPGGSS